LVTRAVVDTSVLIAAETGRRLAWDRLPDQLAVSVVSVGELRAGVLSAEDEVERGRRLDTLTRALTFDQLVIDERVANAWADLRSLLRIAGRRMPVNDSWIAATAMAHRIPVVTQDTDYVEVPGLAVIHV
jgi:predicted nucleic acid-binding protein